MQHIRRVFDRSTGVALLLAGWVLCWPMPGAAQDASPQDTFTLAQAIGLALEANPALQASRLNADAAAERVGPAGAWSDPRLSFGLMNRPLGGFGTDQPMTMNTVQLTQTLSWPGKLGYARERARHLAAAAAWSTEDATVQVIGGVRSLYYEVAYMDRAIAIMERTRDLLRDFFQVSQAMYSVGSGLQQDVLQAQIAIAQMTEDITVMQQNRVAMVARANALMGRDATEPLAALVLPMATPPLPPIDSLLAIAMVNRPVLRATQERVDAADAGYRAARRALYPDLTLTLAYGERPQFDDMMTLMVGFSLPLWAGSRQLPVRREMAAMRGNEEARARDLHNETFAQLTELQAQAERARQLSALYATSIVPQAEAAVESALSAYRVGRVDYMTLVENEMTVNRYQIELVRLAAEYHQAVAQIDALLGRTGVEQ